MNLTLEQWAVVLTAIAAWVGLGLSLYNWNQRRPRQRVEVSFGYPIGRAYPFGQRTYHPRFISITFINERGPTVVIQEVGFEYADRTKSVKTGYMLPYDSLCPTEVLSGRSASYHFDLQELRRGVQEGKPIPVKAYCRDATGHYYKTLLSQEIRSALRIPPEGSNPGGGGGMEASAGSAYPYRIPVGKAPFQVYSVGEALVASRKD